MRRGSVLAAGLTVFFAAGAAVAHAPAGKVKVATTGKDSESRGTIPITRHPRRGERAVMSMSPHRLPDLLAGDRLEVNAELQVTTDCIHHEGGCAGKPYHFDPKVGYRVVLASNEHATSGPDATPITSRRQVRCRQRLPNRQHHCVLVFRHGGIDVGQAAALPCAPADCHVNFVLDAHNRRTHPGDRLIVGGIDPHGDVRSGKGRLNVVRKRPGDQSRVPGHATHHRLAMSLRLPARHREVIFSERLPHLKASEQLVADAKMETDVSRLDYNTRVSSVLILAEHRHSIHRTALTRRVGGENGTLTEVNGFNCTQAQSPCRTLKAGVQRIKRNAVNRSGDPIPLFVNLVTVAKAKRAMPGSGDRVHVLPRGGLHVTRYPASMRG